MPIICISLYFVKHISKSLGIDQIGSINNSETCLNVGF